MNLEKTLKNLDIYLTEDEIRNVENCVKNNSEPTPVSVVNCCAKYFGDRDNPILPLVVVGELCSESNPYIWPIIKEIVKNKLFDGLKRIPFLEVKFWLYYELKPRNILNDREFELIYTAVKIGYSWPGIVGNALNEFAYKDIMSECSTEINDIISSQISLGKGDLNKQCMITQTKGGLSIDLGYGCPLGCVYCYRVSDCTEQYVNKWQPDFFVTPEESIERLLKHPWFTPNITPLGIFMSTTEAFLPNVWPTTLEILVRLDELKITNRVTLITKAVVNENILAKLNELKYIDIDLCICYSNLPKIVEPASSPKKLDVFKVAEKYKNVTMIGYYRPIIEGYNTSEEIIRETFEQYRQCGVKTIVYGGVKLTEDHICNFKDRNLELPNEYKLGGKYISEKTVDRLQQIFKEVFADDSGVKLLRRSSCARVVARGRKIPDYNCHYFYRGTLKGCDPYCAINSMCTRFILPTDKQIKDLLSRINRSKANYIITKDGVYILERLSMYERSFFVQNLLVPVFSAE